jgi:chromosome segregation ATPase
MQAALTDYIRARTTLRAWGLSFTGNDSLTSVLHTFRAQTQANAGETEKLGKQVLKLQQSMDLQRKQQQKSRESLTQQSTALKEKVAEVEAALDAVRAREAQVQDELRRLQKTEALSQQELQVWRDWHRVQHLRPPVCEVGVQAIRLKPRG